VQKYANDRTASLFQTSFEIYLGFRWWSIHHIILRCKVVGQPSSIIPILIHPLSLDQWDFLIIISHDLHFPGCRSRPSHHTPAQNRLHQILTWPAACCCFSSEQHNLVARQALFGKQQCRCSLRWTVPYPINFSYRKLFLKNLVLHSRHAPYMFQAICSHFLVKCLLVLAADGDGCSDFQIVIIPAMHACAKSILFYTITSSSCSIF